MNDPANTLFGASSPAANTPALPFDPTAPAEVMFGDTAHSEAILHDKPDLTISADAFKAANTGWRGALRSLSLSDPEGKEITDLVRHFTRTPPDAATRQLWRATASDAMERRWGPEEARERLSHAKALTQRDSRFAKAMKESGLTDHPRVVELLAERAFSLRAAGQL